MKILSFILLSIISLGKLLFSQGLPDMMHLSGDGHRLITGDAAPKELYTIDEIKTIELWFDDADWWEQLEDNHYSKIDIPATMIYDGDTLLEKIGVHLKGYTSYNADEEKKSFNLSLNFIDSTQELFGYSTLNLNNGAEDPSFMREAIYENAIQKYIPGLAVNWVTLYLNGEYWGIYTNVEQPNKDFYKRWFLSNDGTNWRAFDFGDGLGLITDPYDSYEESYELKSSEKENPYNDLIKAIEILNDSTIIEYEDSVSKYFDIDRTFWFLACENIFTDKDSYVNKGGMDYFIYWEKETGRITPIEYDGNSCFGDSAFDWSLFKSSSNVLFPLTHKLLNIPAFRQRYLAHYRTILSGVFNTDYLYPKIDFYDSLIHTLVQDDPKKIFTYTKYFAEIEKLKELISQRYYYCQVDTEINVSVPVITETFWTVEGIKWKQPYENTSVPVHVVTTNEVFINSVYLYYATGIVGNFERSEMFDDGLHEDSLPADGIFGGLIPGFAENTDVRFYIEVIANDSSQTRMYDPAGAEHDVFYYLVGEPGTFIAIDDNVSNNFIVYPNPTSSVIYIRFGSTFSMFNICLYDVTGKEIPSVSALSTSGEITVTSFPLEHNLIFLRIIAEG